MQPIYKRIKITVPHCPKCNEELTGNNSMILPYQCKCGVWETRNGVDFEVKK